MMIKILGFSFVSGLLGAFLAVYLGFGTLLIVASYLAGSMAATVLSVSIGIAGQESAAVDHRRARQAGYNDQDASKVSVLRPAA